MENKKENSFPRHYRDRTERWIFLLEFFVDTALKIGIISSREHKVFISLFDKNVTFRSLGKEMGITAKRVNGIWWTTMTKLRDFIRHLKPDPILNLGLSTRAVHALSRARISTVSELTNTSAREILNITFVGEQTLEEIRSRLAEKGLFLKGDEKYLENYKQGKSD